MLLNPACLDAYVTMTAGMADHVLSDFHWAFFSPRSVSRRRDTIIVARGVLRADGQTEPSDAKRKTKGPPPSMNGDLCGDCCARPPEAAVCGIVISTARFPRTPEPGQLELR